MTAGFLCGGCNVREPFEHRCHAPGARCLCDDCAGRVCACDECSPRCPICGEHGVDNPKHEMHRMV